MKKCDIIIPIYNAHDCLKDCIESVLNNTDFKTARLILVDDKSPDKRVLPLLKKYRKANQKKIILIENDDNLGFVKTANKGMQYSKNDVILLNSDTIVSEKWLEKIRKCAYEKAATATVTPFSNNRTPMTPLPESFRQQGFPHDWDLQMMAEAVEACSLCLHPEIPTSHGFCMYIKRDALETVGFFDEQNFGKGYGEENDFSFRCLKQGYHHIFCDDVYVFHKGAQSFQDKRVFHNEELARIYPDIMKQVGQWYNQQNLKTITDNILLYIGAAQTTTPNILLLSSENTSEDACVFAQNLASQKLSNVHILLNSGTHFTLRSFFDEFDLLTAVYENPIPVGFPKEKSYYYEDMINELKNIFGISEIDSYSKTTEKQLAKKIRLAKSRQGIDFKLAQKKMLECARYKRLLLNPEQEKNQAQSVQPKPRARRSLKNILKTRLGKQTD